MTDRPIIFSAPMVQALLAGRKTQTRRILKPQPVQNSAGLWVWPPDWTKSVKRYSVGVQTDGAGLVQSLMDDPARRIGYATGDRLWVRESCHLPRPGVPHTLFRADHVDASSVKWRPSIHMPRWASRLTLTVTDVRVEPLLQISQEDAVAEGVEMSGTGSTPWKCYTSNGSYNLPQWSFYSLWNSINGPDAAMVNPWVVVISFDVIRANIGKVEP